MAPQPENGSPPNPEVPRVLKKRGRKKKIRTEEVNNINETEKPKDIITKSKESDDEIKEEGMEEENFRKLKKIKKSSDDEMNEDMEIKDEGLEAIVDL